VRHAHADWTPDECRPLSIRGFIDADRVADVLQRFPIGLLYSSPSNRARQTIAPLAARLTLPVHEIFDLRERRLSESRTEDFLWAVEAIWHDPAFSHPGGESNAAAQQRGVEVIRKLEQRHPGEHIVLSTHGNLLTLILNYFDPAINFEFWKSLTMPDIYYLISSKAGKPVVQRLWS